mgnify:CR=1 FL=1|tara:strand:+ start:2045 stop:2263 length:219 start_codon:yes stop_codon:yes gene_type:complete
MPWNKDGTRKRSTYKMKYQNKHSAFPFGGGAVTNNLPTPNNDIARQSMQNNEETSQITNQSWMGGDWWNKQD